MVFLLNFPGIGVSFVEDLVRLMGASRTLFGTMTPDISVLSETSLVRNVRQNRLMLHDERNTKTGLYNG